MNQLSIGLQLGGQAFSQIIFFENERAFAEYTSGEFEFGAQVTAVAITASAHALQWLRIHLWVWVLRFLVR